MVLSDILSTGVTKTVSGTGSVQVHSAISLAKGRFLQEIVRKLSPTVCLEVGLAYGISALFVCDALHVRKESLYIAIDPNQHKGPWGNDWDGIGMANLGRAGYGDLVQLIEEPSYRALPELERSGQRVDFAFIDGWHTFDFALVDLFYVDRILNVGGVVVFDDAEWPAINKVCKFVRANLAYSVCGVVGSGADVSLEYSPGGSTGGRASIDRVEQSAMHESKDGGGHKGSCVAFQKEANDSRNWNHYVEF